jgi:tRNA(Ile2) C34 agmatinyltransferase TiaS
MKYHPSECPKCGTELVKNPSGGRPTRWCCEGCKRSGESEMARLESVLRLFTEGKYVDMINARPSELRDEALAEMQKRFDHLARVPRQ